MTVSPTGPAGASPAGAVTLKVAFALPCAGTAVGCGCLRTVQPCGAEIPSRRPVSAVGPGSATVAVTVNAVPGWKVVGAPPTLSEGCAGIWKESRVSRPEPVATTWTVCGPAARRVSVNTVCPVSGEAE